jgi:hypothetical protein
MRLATAAFTLVAVAGASCGKKSTPVPDSTSVPIGPTYLSLTASQLDSLDGLAWTGGNTRDRCTNEACTAAKVRVRIDASPGSHLTDSVNGGPTGRLVARVRNLGTVPTYMYHFKPAPFRYYFWVVRSGPAPRWVLIEHQPGSPPDSVGGGRFYGCGHPEAAAPEADFRTCDDVAANVKRMPIPSFAPPTAEPAVRSLRLQPFEAGAWIGCKYGCCPMTS